MNKIIDGKDQTIRNIDITSFIEKINEEMLHDDDEKVLNEMGILSSRQKKQLSAAEVQNELA